MKASLAADIPKMNDSRVRLARKPLIALLAAVAVVLSAFLAAAAAGAATSDTSSATDCATQQAQLQATADSAAPGTVIMDDDFSDPSQIACWGQVFGTPPAPPWTVTGGQLVGDSPVANDQPMVTFGPHLSDFELQVTFQFDSVLQPTNPWFGLVPDISATGPNPSQNFYAFDTRTNTTVSDGVRAADNFNYSGPGASGGAGPDGNWFWTSSGNAAYSSNLGTGTQATVDLVVHGPSASFYLDGQLMLSNIAITRTSTGVLGMYLDSSTVSVSEVKVTKLQTTPSAIQPCGVDHPHPYTHVIWVWMENRAYASIIGSSQAPYLNSLAAECGLATNYHNISHPSLPNYMAATSGLGYSALTAFPDCNPTGTCTSTAESIFAQGETWKAYEESMPSNCYKSDSGEYAVRHDPAVYYTTLQDCSTNVVPYPQLATDLASNALPAFSFITPNVIDDMHSGTTAQGDSWLAANLPVILNSPEYTDGSTVVFITWDEGVGGSDATNEQCATNTTDVSCHVPTLVISPSTPAGTQSSLLFNHYSLLATAEQLLHLPRLGEAASVGTMSGAFKL